VNRIRVKFVCDSLNSQSEKITDRKLIISGVLIKLDINYF
jgi:hypothetical protein